MWLTIKIGVFYGAPILAVLLAAACFAGLLRRVRRGATRRARAALYYAATLLLPLATIGVLWATAQLASYASVPSGQYVWDSGAAIALFIGLLPVAGYVGIPIAALVVLFWLTLAAGARTAPPANEKCSSTS